MPTERKYSTDRLVRFGTLGLSLSLFLTIFYLLCVVGYLLYPGALAQLLSLFIPGLVSLNWHNFGLGLAEALGSGWYIALFFVVIGNFIGRRA